LTGEKEPLEVGKILAPLLELGGIKTSKEIVLNIYIQRDGTTAKLRIRTYQTFLRTLGTVGTYQIVIEEPVIEGVDVNPFKATFLTVEAEYDDKTGWSEIRIHTDFDEEIWPDSGNLVERAKRVCAKIKLALDVIIYIKEIGGFFGGFIGGPIPPHLP
jgi:hypothetical protein